jgi:hypothetical protein
MGGSVVKLLFAVLHLGKSKLEVTVQDGEGHRRRIEFTWLEKEQSDVVPSHWPSSIDGEVEYQRAEEHAEAAGRKLPF